jgi:opacity protein-like surface antigen
MKKYIFALLTMTAPFFSAVHAEESLYVGGFGGVNFASVKEPGGVKIAGIKTGGAGGVCIGYKMDEIRVEGEFAYRTNPFKSTSILKSDGSRTTHTVMANVYYDFNLGTEYTPYVGAGAGYAHNRQVNDMKSGGTFFYTNKFAYQVMGGVHYKYSDKVLLGVEYKFLSPEKDHQNHTTAVSVKRYF